MEILSYGLILISAFYMCFIWMAFIRKVHVFESISWWKMIVALLFGCTTPFYVLALLDYWEHIGFNRNAYPLFVKFIFFVGGIEELAKLLGFLFFYFIFKKWIKQEIHAFLYASVVGLGFATVENMMYMDNHGVQLIFIRGVLCDFGHLTGPAMIVGAFIWGKRKSLTYGFLYGFVGFLFAMILHGLYDSFLSIEIPIFNFLFAILIFMLEIEIWSQFANNYVNLFDDYKENEAIDRKTMQQFLFSSFVIATIIQDIGYIVEYGLEGIGSMILFMIVELIIVLILVFRITRFQIRPRLWKKMKLTLPFKYNALVYPDGRTGHQIVIKGEEFNEYPFTTRIKKNVLFIGINSQKDTTPIQSWILKKVFLGNKKELYYLCESPIPFIHASDFNSKAFLIKPKLTGKSEIDGYPIVGVFAIPLNTDVNQIQLNTIQFQRYVVFHYTDQEPLHQSWKQMII